MRTSDLLKLPDAASRRLNLHARPRKYVREERKKLSRDELMDYLRRNGIKSRIQLGRFRKPGDPTVHDFRKEFGGKWSNALREAFGATLKPEIDKNYILQTVNMMNLWTWRSYLAARRAHPDIVPSMYAVLKRWHRFSDMVVSAKTYSVNETLKLSVRLYQKYGRTPTDVEYKAARIQLEYAHAAYGGRSNWNKCVKYAVRRIERERERRSA